MVHLRGEMGAQTEITARNSYDVNSTRLANDYCGKITVNYNMPFDRQ
jgi:hypothetical protein